MGLGASTLTRQRGPQKIASSCQKPRRSGSDGCAVLLPRQSVVRSACVLVFVSRLSLRDIKKDMKRLEGMVFDPMR